MKNYLLTLYGFYPIVRPFVAGVATARVSNFSSGPKSSTRLRRNTKAGFFFPLIRSFVKKASLPMSQRIHALCRRANGVILGFSFAIQIPARMASPGYTSNIGACGPCPNHNPIRTQLIAATRIQRKSSVGRYKWVRRAGVRLSYAKAGDPADEGCVVRHKKEYESPARRSQRLQTLSVLFSPKGWKSEPQRKLYRGGCNSNP